MDCLWIARRQLFKLRLYTHGCNLQSPGDDEASWESPSTPVRQSRLRQLNSITYSTKTWWASCAAFLQQNAYVCFMANKYTAQIEWELKCPVPREFIVERKISCSLFLCFSFHFYGVEEVRLLIVHPVNCGSSAGGGRWQGAVPTSPHIPARSASYFSVGWQRVC